MHASKHGVTCGYAIGFVSKGHGILTKVEHGFVITVVWCETAVVIMSALLETMIVVQDCSLEVEQV